MPQIKALFPEAEVKIIKGATHWVHADAPEQLLKEILDFELESGGNNVHQRIDSKKP